jgi:acyl-CoA hydrolase
MKSVSPAEAVSIIQSGHRVFVHGMAAAPASLVAAMTERADELRDVEVVHLHTEGEAAYAAPGLEESFRVNNLFIGPNLRDAVNSGRADYVPVFLSEVPSLFRRGVMPIDVALMQVSPPDRNGFCSLGVSVDASLAAMQCAKQAAAEINPNMPRTHGDGFVHISRFSHVVDCLRPLPEHLPPPIDEVSAAIGRKAAELIEDGATLQMGIGAIPNAVLAALGGHKGLGIHSEMFSDGVVDLVEQGVITGENKTRHPGKIIGGFVSGSRRLYDFVDDNPLVQLLDIAYVNDTAVIRRLPKMTSINSAVEIDLTGQVCADSIGSRMFSGVGGQMDFVRGASLSDGGKAILALPSETRRGESRICAMLKPGAGVVTTRAHVHHVVTEHGAVDLYGRNLRQRAALMISIAAPHHREGLARQAREELGLKVD